MPKRSSGLTFLYAATLFVSASLLFWVQPMLAKMLLPLLGGTPAVWNTCMLFFQAMLLAGYAYALAVSKWLTLRQQIAVHTVVLLSAALSFPILISESTIRSVPREGNPSLWLLGSLLTTVGLPFFAVATNSPLLQKWFAETRQASARDPYFLYAASNAGSLLALLSYPLIVEPRLTLGSQSRLWALGYALLVALIAVCAVALLLRRQTRRRIDAETRDQQTTSQIVSPRVEDANSKTGALHEATSDADAQAARDGDATAATVSADAEAAHDADAESTHDADVEAAGDASVETLSWRRRLHWVALAFVPSSLMLGVTTYFSTDIASLPLLWVVPLSLYLLTLVFAFARRQIFKPRTTAHLLPGVALVFALVYLSGATQPVWLLLFSHLFFFVVAAMACHAQLAADRPGVRHLAEFYLLMSVGGVLGGLFNALLAPTIFNTTLEYPLIIVLACLVLPRLGASRGDAAATDTPRERWLDVGIPAGVALFTVVLALVVNRFVFDWLQGLALVTGVPLIISYLFKRRPVRFALALGAVMLGSSFHANLNRETLLVERNFFGTLRVTQDAGSDTHWLYHGTTIHGRQSLALNRHCEPLSYYHREGPLGQVFKSYEVQPANPNVAIVGLGTGATAAYTRAGQNWTFYEINPAVVQIARDPTYFTYLSYCAAAPISVSLGDARLQLQDAPPAHYGLIVLDAFSSDAIPMHLMTVEALDLYLSKLAPGGLLVFHISNRSLDLHPVVADLAHARSLLCLSFDDIARNQPGGKEPSQWVVMARRAEDVQTLAADARWQQLEGRPGRPVWSDDFSNIVSIFKWH